ncbi:MAG: M23 family metallopeptidase [Ignavibacteria bacterium]|nr:M23 family metallopeptidase [Ignavibacteria bacterium]
MKKFYYFSKSKLKFVEIRNFYKKFVFLVLFASILVSFFLFGTYLVFNEFINPDSEVKALKRSNALLKEKFETLLVQYKSLDERIANLTEKSHDLRLAVNLESRDTEEIYGVGGALFTPLKSNNPQDLFSLAEDLESYLNKISLKVKLEKNNYEEIENTLKQNEILYSAIPAIRPTYGSVLDDFGMRVHPILRIRRMHNGIDIITDVGTNVYAPGSGKVEFVGRRGGYGLTVEINHGFGYKTIYAHLSKINVKEGQSISRGELIALTGNSGSLSTGPHLHYEVRHNGIPLNPRNFIYDDVELFEIVKK